MTRGSRVSLAADIDLGGFVWVVPLEWKKFVGLTKVGKGTQIQSRSSVFGAVARDGLKATQRLISNM